MTRERAAAFVLAVVVVTSGAFSRPAGAAPPAPVRVPVGGPVLVDTRCDDAEWTGAARVATSDGATLLVQQDTERVYLCVPLPADSYGTMDLYVWPAGASQPVNLHASAQVGERTRTAAGWPAWSFGNERGWYSPPVALAEATAVDGGRPRLRFQPVAAREVAIEKRKFGGGPWQVLVEIRALGPDKQGALRFPADGHADAVDTWASLDLTPPASTFAASDVETLALASADLGETRPIWIQGPAACRTDRACDLLIVLDADALFPIATAYARVMQTMGRMTPLVIVGVPSRSPADRLRLFTTPVADGFVRFLGREVVAAAATRFRVTDRHVLAGHSLAGLLAVHALASAAAFESYIALSPTLGWNDQQVLDVMQARLAVRAAAPRRLFVSIARDTPPYLHAYDRFERQATAAAAPWLTTRFERFTDEDHVTTVAPALQRAMQWLFAAPRP